MNLSMDHIVELSPNATVRLTIPCHLLNEAPKIAIIVNKFQYVMDESMFDDFVAGMKGLLVQLKEASIRFCLKHHRSLDSFPPGVATAFANDGNYRLVRKNNDLLVEVTADVWPEFDGLPPVVFISSGMFGFSMAHMQFITFIKALEKFKKEVFFLHKEKKN